MLYQCDDKHRRGRGRIHAKSRNDNSLTRIPPWLDEHAQIVLGMVAADATEIHIAGYLRSVVRQTGAPPREPLGARPTAISLWHIAKSALVRDFAERVLKGEIPPNEATADSLSHWIATKLLTPAELAQFEEEGRHDPDSDDD